MQFVRREALLGRAQEMDREKPLMERDVAVFEDGPNRHRELLTAGAALEKPLAPGPLRRRLRREPRHRVGPAMRAFGSIRPPKLLHQVARRVLVREVRGQCRQIQCVRVNRGHASHLLKPS